MLMFFIKARNYILHEIYILIVFFYLQLRGANIGPTWVLSAPAGPHVGSMNLAYLDGYFPLDIFNKIVQNVGLL